MKEGSGVVFSNGEISNNQAADTGGAIFISGGSTGEFNSSVFYNNRGAIVGGGVNTTGAGIGAIFDSGADFNNCTFSNNYGVSGGVGGFYGASSTINIFNSILWNNNGDWQGTSGQMLGSAQYNVTIQGLVLRVLAIAMFRVATRAKVILMRIRSFVILQLEIIN